MITHPGTLDSQTSAAVGSPGYGYGSGQKRGRSDSESNSSDALHSGSTSSESEDEFGGKKGIDRARQAAKGMSSSQPKIIMTTTKEKLLKDAAGLRHDVHEKVQDLTPGGTGRVLLSTTSNQVG